MSEDLEVNTQMKIHEIISKYPGIHLSKIAEMLNMNIIQVERYLIFLEKKGEIFSSQETGYTGYHIEKNKKTLGDRRTQETRRKIHDLIAKNPGLYLSKIAEMLNMRTSLAEYHLLYLEKNNIIIAIKEEGGYYKRFYIKEHGLGIRDKRILALLQHESLLKIVLILIKNPRIKHKELSETLGISPSTLSHHLARLVDNEILETHSYGREKGYALKDKDEILRIIKKYELHIELRFVIDAFKEMWEDFEF